MSKETIKIPDIGSDSAEVIELCVSVGDELSAEDSLVVLESDKASMEVPCPKAGRVVAILVESGQSVSEGDALVELEVADAEVSAVPPEQKMESAPEAEEKEVAPVTAESNTAKVSSEAVRVPDIGTDDAVDVIEVCVAAGEEISEGDALVVLESDKASMEIPAPFSGKVESVQIKAGDKAKQGDAILVMSVAGTATVESPKISDSPKQPEGTVEAISAAKPEPKTESKSATAPAGGEVYAGPAVRKLAREFAIDLKLVVGTGPKGRLLKEDLQSYVRNLVENRGGAGAGGAGIPAVPEVDFAQFGPVDKQALSKLAKLTAANMHRSWLNVPHVTQFDDADVTELETFRKGLKEEAVSKGVKMTPLPFLLKACAVALRENPKFNASLADGGESIVYKKYVHIGIAVDTPAGLVVPVVRDVDKKTLWELASECADLAAKAKDRKLKPQDMQGGCFTISSLGGIGGQGFTPIVNTPEVGILGVSKLTTKPVWDGKAFVPRQMLPLSLSYDHRAINGADAGKFMTFLVEVLSDIRRLAL